MTDTELNMRMAKALGWHLGASGGWVDASGIARGGGGMSEEPEYIREKRIMLRRQIESIWSIRHVRIECPCGRSMSLIIARKCHYCGIWFCPACAQDHFGPNGKMKHDEAHTAPASLPRPR